MADGTKIEWATATLNWLGGCTRVSEGCAHCYAITTTRRLAALFDPRAEGGEEHPALQYRRLLTRDGRDWSGRVVFIPKRLEQLKRWRKPRVVFHNSLSDTFHESVSDEVRDEAFSVIGRTPQHQHLILTKREEVMLAYVERLKRLTDGTNRPTPWPNVWLGVTAENQQRADERLPVLARLAAAGWNTFVSIEPMLGPVDLGLQSATCDCCARWPSRWVELTHAVHPDVPGRCRRGDAATPGIYRAEGNRHGALSVRTSSGELLGIRPGEFTALPGFGGVIVGGESGPDARPCHPDWVRSVRDQCAAAGTPLTFKQWGAWIMVPAAWGERPEGTEIWTLPGGVETCFRRVGKKKAGRMLDGVIHDAWPPKKRQAEG